MDAFAGTWSSGTLAGGTGNVCSAVDYTFSKTSETSADVKYSGTCAGIAINGTGSATLSGSTLNWQAAGTASRGGLSCAFTFANSTATPQGDAVLIVYNGSVCGVPVSGSQVVHKH